MPRRTNPFQELCYRIQAALFGLGAKVEQSALVRNHASGSLEEIDILVEFCAGDQTYTTGIACRDHKRKQGSAWIRDLAKQREHCRLDKVIAICSAGFTRSAVRTAAQEKVALLTVDEIETVSWEKAVDPRPQLLTLMTFAKLLGYHLKVPPGYGGAASNVKALISEKQRWTIPEFESHCCAILREIWLLREDVTGTTDIAPVTASHAELTGWMVKGLHEPKIELDNGQLVPVLEIAGNACVRWSWETSREVTHARMGDSAIVQGRMETPAAFDVVAVTSEKKKAVHVKPADPRAFDNFEWTPEQTTLKRQFDLVLIPPSVPRQRPAVSYQSERLRRRNG